jgi:carboxyl-terminal processing protease
MPFINVFHRNPSWAASFVMAAIAAACLTACGDSGSDAGSSSNNPNGLPPSATCDVPEQNQWLRNYMLSDYLWSGVAPSPEPGTYKTVQSYFDAQLFAGDATVPKDRWSYIETTTSHNDFFVEGKSMGYGFSVNGIEKKLPLKVRYIEPKSPAINALMRGDVILSMNGRAAADLIASQDFPSANPSKEGETLTLVVERGNAPKTIVLTSARYSLTPVPTHSVLDLADGTKVGYLPLKDFITQAEMPLATAISNIRAAGASQLILDLRYNGGGRVSTANVLAALIAGASNNGKVFARLNYNAKSTSSNYDFRMNNGNGAAFTRVVILTGSRSCSASELLVNGLKPYTTVVTIGGATCGKPFGFTPVNNCTSTYSAVNFESFNAQGQGRYYNGIPATCTVADDFTGQLGSATEKLTTAALIYLQTGACPPADASARQQPTAVGQFLSVTVEPGERQGMWGDRR